MADRTQTARVIVAVQEALRANRIKQRPLVEPGSVAILEALRTDTVAIGELARSVDSITEWKALSTLRTLADSGLVRIDEERNTASLTAAGRAALGD